MKKLVLLFVLGIAACGKDPEPASIAPPAPTTSIDDGDPVPPAPTGRKVSFRNPFGDMSYPDNLMVDGDFELTGRAGQMPWLAGNNQGARALDYDTGGVCRSGVRCAHVPSGTYLVGYMATPPAGKIFARVWAKPDSGKCSDVKSTIVDGTANAQLATLASQTPGPDDAGWCRYEAVIGAIPFHQPVMVVSASGSTATVDDVLALPTAGSKPNLAGPPLTKREEAEILKLVSALKKRGQPIFPPPMDPQPLWLDTP